MTKNSKVAHAPYNFVPFPEKIITRYDSFDDLPSHNASKPGEEELLSGEVTFDIVAETPLLVADGRKDENDKNAPRTFVKNAECDYVIPGSTLRGLMRSTMSVLSLSNWTDRIDDATFFYRRMAESNTELSNYYKQLLRVEGKKFGSKWYSFANKVKAGYLVKKTEKKYVIYGAKADNKRHRKSYYTYFISDISDKRYKEEFKKKLSSGFINEGIKFSLNRRGKPVNINDENTTFKGQLVFTGPIPRKEVAYIINEIDDSIEVELSYSDIKDFLADYNFRKRKTNQSDESSESNYEKLTSLPKDTGIEHAKPCFYINTGKQVYFGHTPFLRVKYNHSIRDIVKKQNESFENISGIDYVHALFGFFSNKKQNKHYASRLSFLPSILKNSVRPMKPIPVVLGSPRASALGMYLKQDLKSKD